MKKIFQITILIIIVIGCKPTDRVVKSISCSDDVTIQYDKNNQHEKSKPRADKNLKAFQVVFLSDFNDSIQCNVNGDLKFEKFIKRDGNSHGIDESFGYNYSKDKNLPILKVVSKTRNTCFDIKIDEKCKLIYVFIYQDKWIARFSNIYYVD